MLRWLTFWLAQRQGLEVHYLPRADPPLEPQGTLQNDGTPCAPPPAGGRAPIRSKPTTYSGGRR